MRDKKLSNKYFIVLIIFLIACMDFLWIGFIRKMLDGFVFKKELSLDEIFTSLSLIFVAILTYYLGLGQYLNRRRGERVRKTYIEEGIGKVIRGTDKLSSTCYFNYAKVRSIFDILKETTNDPESRKDLVIKIFSEMEGVKIAPDYGIIKMSIFNNTNLVLLITQMWMKLQQFNETMRHIELQNVKDYFSEQCRWTEEERKSFLSEQENIIREEWRKIMRKYEPLKGSLLLLQIEIDKMDFLCIEDIDKIEKQKGVVKIIEEIEKTYKESLEKLAMNKKD